MEKIKQKNDLWCYFLMLASTCGVFFMIYLFTSTTPNNFNNLESRRRHKQTPVETLLQKLHHEAEKLSLEIQQLKRREDIISKEHVLTPEKKHSIFSMLDIMKDRKKVCSDVHHIIVLCLSNQGKEYRDVIRETWGRDKIVATSDGDITFDFHLLFIVDDGDVIGYEKSEFNDLIIVENIEQNMLNVNITNFNNFKDTMKTMLALYWLDSNCAYDFVLKITDEMFLNTPKLFSFIHDPKTPKTELYGGNINYGSAMIDHPGYIKTNETFVPMNPRYAKGETFLLSFDLVMRFLEYINWDSLHHYSKAFMYPDLDVYLGELVLKAGVDVWQMNDMNVLKWKKQTCQQHYNVIGLNNIVAYIDEPDCMRYLYKLSKKYLIEI